MRIFIKIYIQANTLNKKDILLQLDIISVRRQSENNQPRTEEYPDGHVTNVG